MCIGHDERYRIFVRSSFDAHFLNCRYEHSRPEIVCWFFFSAAIHTLYCMSASIICRVGTSIRHGSMARVKTLTFAYSIQTTKKTTNNLPVGTHSFCYFALNAIAQNELRIPLLIEIVLSATYLPFRRKKKRTNHIDYYTLLFSSSQNLSPDGNISSYA